MAEQGKELDANEPATPFKLEKARERGSIARSVDVNFAIVLLVSVACVYGLGAQVLDGVSLLLRRALSFAGRDQLSQTSALAYMGMLASEAVLVIAPVVFVIWLSALLVSAMQARGVFTAQPLKPDFARLNPAAGLKRLFSLKSLNEVARSLLRIGAISLAGALWGQHHLGRVLELRTRAPRSAARLGLDLLGSALALLAGLAVVFALLDWGFNRWDYLRQMRMSRRELKDERKEREGDPRIKAKLRELRLAWLRRARQLAKVAGADVLLTNPTHYAVALEYRHGEMPAPMITAKGAGELAQRMRAEARRHAVPVVEDAPLTRALFTLPESQAFVPEEHFNRVARVLRWVYAARARYGAAGTGAVQ
jgi:flagellar biosynthetic protein FlhB